MANPNPQDPYGGIQAFQSAIDPVQVAAQSAPNWASGRQPSGYEHAGGGIAFLGTKLLEGITKGRVSAFAKQESEKAQTFDRMTKMMQMVDSDQSIDPELKASLKKQYLTMLGRVGSSQVKEASKGAKDDGNPARKHITGVIGSIFDKMAGGPFKGDPMTVDHMSKFMGDVTEAISGKDKDPSSQSAFAKQNQILQEGIAEAQAAAKSSGRHTVSYEQVNNNPKVASALQWYAQYAPQQLSVVQQRFAGLPSENNPQQISRAEALAIATKPRQVANQTPPALRADAPPAERTALSANGTPVVPPGPPPARAGTPPPYLAAGDHAGPPKLSPEEEHDQKMYDQLMVMSGYGPKPERDVPYRDPKTGAISMIPESASKALFAGDRIRISGDVAENNKNDKATLRKEWEKKFTQQASEHLRGMNQRDRQLNQNDIALGIRGAEYQLRETENDEKQAPQRAMAKLIKRATDSGIPFSDFADNVNQFLQHNDDPDIDQQRGYIADQVSRMKQRAKGGSYQEMMDMMTGKPPAPPGAKPAVAPPNTRTATAGPVTMAPSNSKPAGLVTPGNVDLSQQPEIPNPAEGGKKSTVYSSSFEIDGKFVLLPRVVKGVDHILTTDEALAHYKATGQHLGIFKDQKSADDYGRDSLHKDYENGAIKTPKAGAAPLSRKASALGSKLGISLDGPAASSSAPDLSKLSDEDLFKQAAGSR